MSDEPVPPPAAEDDHSDDELPFNRQTNDDQPDDKSSQDEELLRQQQQQRRTQIHAKLRAYESKRRTAYESKLQSSSLYWHAFRSLMHDSVLETQKADLFIRGWVHLAEMYGEGMASLGEWCVDEKGGVILDGKEKRRFLERANNEKRGAAAGATGVGGGGGGVVGVTAIAGDHNHSAATSIMFPGQKSGGLPTGMMEFYREEKCGLLIHSFADSATNVSGKHGDMTKYMNNEVLPELASLLTHLKTEVVFMEKLGDSIMKELETAEEEVCKAWESYYNRTLDVISTSSTEAMKDRLVGAKDTSEGSPPDAALAVAGCTDVWVEEMRYRMAVAFLSSVWEKCSSELSKLFLNMKETECKRRNQIKELMIKAVQQQERLWMSLPSVITPILKELVEWPMEQKTVEDDVQYSIRERAQSIQRDEVEHKKSGEGSKTPAPGLTGVQEGEGNFELSSPLVSDLMCKAKVVEKRSPGMISSWKVSLAVVTHDSFLHLFELPSTSKLHSGSAPEVAFQNLIPPVVVPSMEGVKAGIKFPASTKHWFDHLVPTESFALPNCVVTLRENDPKNPNSFEVVETMLTSGASKMFAKTVNRKMQFRTVTREEAKDFVDALKSSSRKS